MEMDDLTSAHTLTEPVLSTILYFDIFNHPVNQDEIHSFCPVHIDKRILPDLLRDMCESGLVKVAADHYGVGDIAMMVSRRRQAEKRAEEVLAQAYENGRFIERFPFVNSVFLSGSISKNVMHEESDVDYFILSNHERVWISMLILKLYKKFALRKRSEFFCLNYFVSDQAMEIEEQSMFTAVEIATLHAVRETDLKESLIKQNSWVKEILPNHPFHCQSPSIPRGQKATAIRLLEKTLSGRLGDLVDRFIRRFIEWFNRAKFRQFKGHPDWELMFRTHRNQAKFHSKNHHRKIINLHQERLASSQINAPTVSKV